MLVFFHYPYWILCSRQLLALKQSSALFYANNSICTILWHNGMVCARLTWYYDRQKPEGRLLGSAGTEEATAAIGNRVNPYLQPPEGLRGATKPAAASGASAKTGLTIGTETGTIECTGAPACSNFAGAATRGAEASLVEYTMLLMVVYLSTPSNCCCVNLRRRTMLPTISTESRVEFVGASIYIYIYTCPWSGAMYA